MVKFIVSLHFVVLLLKLENAEGAPMERAINVCQTSACLRAASFIKSALNQSADPCDDFYEFACGGYIATHQIPANESRIGTLDDLDDQTAIMRQAMLETSGSAFESEQKIKDFYRSCIDSDFRESVEGQPILRLLGSVLPGGWPVLNPSWSPDSFNLLDTLVAAREFVSQPLVNFLVSPGLYNPLMNQIGFGEPETFIPVDVLQSDIGEPALAAYLDLMRRTTSLLLKDSGLDVKVETLDTSLVEIVEFEVKLINTRLSAVEAFDPRLYFNTTFGSFTDTLLPSSSFGDTIFQLVKRTFAAVGITDEISRDTIVSSTSAKFYRGLNAIMSDVDQMGDDGKRLLANYIGWKIIYSELEHLSSKYQNLKFKFKNRIQSPIEAAMETPLTKRCTNDVIAAMPLAAAAIYVRNYVPADLKSNGLTLATDVTEGFRQLLLDANFMAPDTKAFALRKLDVRILVMAYADVVVNNISAVDFLYGPLIVGPVYFDTRINILRQLSRDNLLSLLKPNVRGDPFFKADDITQVNAYFDPQLNQIFILAGIMQSPLFDAARPQYLNFGGLGYVIGHETTHGFDTFGSQFDDVGGLRDWWDEMTFSRFIERATTIIDQYSNYSLPSGAGNVNGLLTVTEDVADNGGLKAARIGYERYQARLAYPEPSLPYLEEFTNRQMFFIAGGQNWCGKATLESEKTQLLTNPHSPGRFRVNGVVVNMPEFAMAFHCPLGSNMNPVVKNAVW